MTYSLAVDIGGTFTDIVLRNSDGRLSVDKTLTTHEDLLSGFFGGVNAVLKKAGISSDAIDGVIVHATTVVTNALIERKGPPTALVVTEGFRDVLSIRNEHRYDMYDPQIEFPEPLVPIELTFGIAERTLADGTVAQTPSDEAIEVLAADIRKTGAQSVAICFLNSFVNSSNEAYVAGRLSRLLNDLFICTSSDVAPQIREYPRASTATVNAYTMPISQPYLRRLSDRLRDEGFGNSPLIMLSSGGVVGAETAGRNPVRMIESGPAAGALAACHYAEVLGIDRLMSFDMGGTTAKACLIENRTPLVTGLFEVDRRYRFKEGSGLPVTVPSIDLIEIGAGGGSIAHVDELGLLKVGPESAGSNPGPACYGRGGKNATVTDADLMLGLIDADNFLGGEMRLDTAATEHAMKSLADGLGTTPVQASRGIYRVVTEAMASAARAHATDRGVDYRGLPLFAFGGAGPLHACGVAELLQSASVIVPPRSSVLSAFGTLVTPLRLDLVRSDLVRLDAIDWARTEKLLGELEKEGRLALMEAGCEASDVEIHIGADLRYFGQQHEVTVTFDHDPRKSRDTQAIEALFSEAYHTLYGVNPSHVPVEVVSWRITVNGPAVHFHPAGQPASAPGQPKGHRPVHAWQDGQMVVVYERGDLAVGQVVEGPVIIEERETTTAIPPNWVATIDAFGCIVATRKPAQA
ncbi:hydantoinase/oxoprolinase family protein [Mycoplana rhizolycopersici]|uniref:Hydantoinase/oxoprolinase family protein n=1 Tax=Mycoplana rhizolycopersici TaxID=2746702 RepID=A0ABX2QJ91_9HYPH|nr:hydantoinase/oxoprolinase family protein [Rhizobium rhizolycopersici]NVP56959.1 hydantoinase/oxoprolinase family protein [Rhizobium rhizolycopersici]